MSFKNLLFISLFSISSLHAQDIVVQAFNFESTTRDTMIDFPNVDNNEFEKILMLYSMRCKDGRVSPPISGRTNEGCGEWDFSCNTYITDESQTDSIKASGPTHEISRFSGDVFPYVTEPTYSYYEFVQKNVTSVPDNSAIETNIGLQDLSSVLEPSNNRSQLLYTASQLQDAGMQSGKIISIKLDIQNTFGEVKNLRVRLKNTNKTDLNDQVFETRGFTTVYFLDRELSMTENAIHFNRPYNWNGTSNIIVDISYDAAEGDAPVLQSSSQSEVIMLQSKDIDRRALSFDRSGYIQPQDENLDVSSEITISLWAYGGLDQPFNSTVAEGLDDNNNRQVNIHFPWSDGRIYWDCGNDGTGYDRISRSASAGDYKNGWNHWAFTKNATTGSMRIYLNGTQWHAENGKNKLIDVQSFVIGNSIPARFAYQGKIDQFTVWNKELSAENIKAWMGKYITPDHPDYDNLILYYPFDNDQVCTVTDASAQQNNGGINGPLLYRAYEGYDIPTGITGSNNLPNITFIQDDDATIEVSDILKLDSLVNHANQVDEYELQGTDRILIGTQFYYLAGDMPVFNESGNIIRTINVPLESSIDIETLNYYRKSAMKYEIMSFVTPYGINLDLGIEGKTWTFDVTDFGPILNGRKRLNMQAGGEWQEDMDIKFVFVRGTPSRDVHSIAQIWPVTSSNFTNIMDDRVFEPRDIAVSNQSSMFKLKAAITGHGQEGEFIQRSHTLDVNGYTERQWNVWKQCAENPIYPQGGTWIFDRAGWCPGEATDIEELDLTELITPGEMATLDYGVTSGSGDSRYIVNVQMVSYGNPNFALDAEMMDIINPSNKIEYGRFNPVCGSPKVLIRNNGEERLSSLDIIYGINGAEQTYNWTGFLDYLETEEVELDMLDLQAMVSSGGTFTARVSNPNGSADTYDNNNQMSAMFDIVPIHEEDIMINFKTNNRGNETSYLVEDMDGNIILTRNGNLPANREYRDTLRGLAGCYRLVVRDLDNDGLNFFANNDGSGFIRIKNVDGPFTVLESDFGRSVIYEFIAGNVVVGTQDEQLDLVRLAVSPNPGNGLFEIDFYGLNEIISLEVSDQTGKVLKRDVIQRVGADRYTYPLDLTSFTNGVFFVKVRGKNGIKTIRIIKIE